MRALTLLFLFPHSVFAQEQAPKPADVPNVATEIVIEDLTVTVKRLRIGVALSPEQIEGLTKALSGTGAQVKTSDEGTSD